MRTDVTLKKVRLSVSNAVQSLSVLVAYEEGLFYEQGKPRHNLRYTYADLSRLYRATVRPCK